MEKYLCSIGLEKRIYPDSKEDIVKLMSVTAGSKVEAEQKIEYYYSKNSDLYGVSYRVKYIEFSENLDLITP